MTGRPEVLFGLFGALEGLDGVGPKTARMLAALGVSVPRDLLFLLPFSVVDRRPCATLRDLVPPAIATVQVEIGQHLPPRQRGRPYRVLVRDRETEFLLVYFHARADAMARLLPTGQQRLVSGKIEAFDGVLQMVHPDHVLRPDEAATLPDFEPVYPLTAGLTQKTLRKAALAALARAPGLSEWIDPELHRRMGWPDWREALQGAHHPQHPADLTPIAPARQRLSYDELFAHQVTLAMARAARRRVAGQVTRAEGRLFDKVKADLGYPLTSAQERSINEILADMAAPLRMNRLLQGDVGAGKTLVALAALLAAVEGGGQGVLMAPTEILARQHLEALGPLSAQAGVRVDILTGRDRGSERARKLADLAAGRIGILLGTHAVFQADVQFHDLRLAVIDEQHRFGVAQRMALGDKGARADVLVMTATPIPRSLALAQYGDMDLSVLDQKPPGRQPVRTVLVSSARLDETVEHLRKAVAEGRQAYWVCPLVEESEAVNLTAAQTRFDSLRAALGETVALVHGQMPAADKDAAMARFVSGRAQVLVATTVIEVGVNVPNATIMVIERAEAFGLAQLHQLRGRVGRGSGASTCVLLYDPPLGEAAERRLKLMRDTEDGFRISEEDMALRGAGDVLGTAQSGLPRFRIADLERQVDLMAIAQTDARKLLYDDPGLTSARGQATRALLWLTGQDQAIRLLQVG